jgi:hypothetical protein
MASHHPSHHPGHTTTRFEQLLASYAHVHTLQCVHINTPSSSSAGDTTSLPPHTTLVIESHSTNPSHAMQFRCPKGGVSFHVARGWRQEAASVHVKTGAEKHEVASTFSATAKQMDWTAGTMTLVADQLRLQSSRSPCEIHSFSTRPNGIALRCPKGGVEVAAGTTGLVQHSTGDVDIQLRGGPSTLRLASHGDSAHTIRIGNRASETVIEHQLTVKGRLVLADTAEVEKRVAVVHELQNVLEFGGGTRADSTHNTTTSTSTSTPGRHPDAGGYDFGMIARQGPNKAGVVYDHTKGQFYFASELGAYQHHRFAHPRVLADVQGKALLAKQRVQAPFVEAHTVQCRTIRTPNATGPSASTGSATSTASAATSMLTLQAPIVRCTETFRCASIETDLGRCTRLDTGTLTAQDGSVANTLHVGGDVRVGGNIWVQDRMPLATLFARTVGPHSAHRTLQDALDDECMGSPTPTTTTTTDNTNPCCSTRSHHPLPPDHLTMEPVSCPPHNCTAIVNQPRLLLDGRHSTLTGTLELTDECEELRIVDARVDRLTIMSSAEYQREHARPSEIVLRNVSGTVTDWHFDLPRCTLRLEYCTLRFLNGVTGTLGSVKEIYSTSEGHPWRTLHGGHVV